MRFSIFARSRYVGTRRSRLNLTERYECGSEYTHVMRLTQFLFLPTRSEPMSETYPNSDWRKVHAQSYNMHREVGKCAGDIQMLTLMQTGIEEYAESKSEPHSKLLDELMKETYAVMSIPQMVVGSLEGTFLRMMVEISKAKHVLEIGMFTGYSALAMAEGLPPDGRLTTLEIDPKAISIAMKYFSRSEQSKKIHVIEGPAAEVLEQLPGPFDLVFIDADKTNYKNYYEAVLPKMPSGGIILVDNVLWSGRVLAPETEDDVAIAEFNDHVSKDSRVERVLLTIRDGVFFIRKK